MKKRNLVIGLLVAMAVALTGASFAFWASGISGNTNSAENEINIGAGDAVTTTVSISDLANTALPLVPVGREEVGVTVSVYTFTFEVTWAGASSAADAAGSTGDLSVQSMVLTGLQEDGITAVGAPELALFDVATVYVTSSVVYGSTTVIQVTVTFTDEPADAAQYDLIANATLSLDVTFLVDNVSFA